MPHQFIFIKLLAIAVICGGFGAATQAIGVVPVGCLSKSAATLEIDIPRSSSSSDFLQCSQFCGQKFNWTLSTTYFGLVNGNGATEIVTKCLCYSPSAISSVLSQEDLSKCNATSVDSRAPVPCGVNTQAAEANAAVYLLASTMDALRCERQCRLNETSPCEAVPFSAECAVLLAGCYLGNATAVENSCKSGDSAATNSTTALLPHSECTYNLFMRTLFAGSRELHLHVIDPGRPSEIKSNEWQLQNYGWIYPPGSQIETTAWYIVANEINQWYPRMCPSDSSGCDNSGLLCADNACSTRPSSSNIRPSLRIRNDAKSCSIYGDCWLHKGTITLADPSDPPERRCRTYELYVEGWHNFQLDDFTYRYEMTELLHTTVAGCQNTLARWQFTEDPATGTGGTVDGVLRPDNVYERYQCEKAYDEYDRDLLVRYTGVGNDSLCAIPADPTVLISNNDMLDYYNCATFLYDVHLLCVTCNYVGYLVSTMAFAGSLIVGDLETAVIVPSGTFWNLTTIGGDLLVQYPASLDLDGVATTVDIAGDFRLISGANGGRYSSVASIGGSMVLNGNVSSAVLPKFAILRDLRLIDFVGMPGLLGQYTSIGTIFITSQSTSFVYAFDTLETVTEVFEVDLKQPTSVSMVVPVPSIPYLTLTRASRIAKEHFPALVQVTQTLWVNDVTVVDWPADSTVLEVIDLSIGTLDTERSSCTSLGNLRVHVKRHLLIQSSDLVDLRFLADVTELASLTIIGNGAMANLSGLENLRVVHGNVVISGNKETIDISALGNMVRVDGIVDIVAGSDRYTTIVTPCPCGTYGLFCAAAVVGTDQSLAAAWSYVIEGDERDNIALMAQALLCAKVLVTNGFGDVEALSIIAGNITVRSYARGEMAWNLVAFDAVMFLKAQLQGPTTPFFVPMDATATLLERMQFFVQAYSVAEDEYDELIASIDQLEAVLNFKTTQLDRSTNLAVYISNSLDRYINERDAAIAQMVRASEEVAVASYAIVPEIENILAGLQAAGDARSIGMSAIRDTFVELVELEEILGDFEDETGDDTSMPSVASGSGRRRQAIMSYVKAAVRLFGMVKNIFDRAKQAHGQWEEANEALDDFYLVIEHLHTYIAYVSELEDAVATVGEGGDLTDLDDLLESGNFTTLADWVILPPSLRRALLQGDICFSGSELALANQVACDSLMISLEVMSVWGSQVTALAGAISEYERAIGTCLTALDQLARNSKELGYVVADLEEMTDDAIAAARFHADQFMATISTVALYELQQLCSSLSYYAPDTARQLAGCDVTTYYVGMSSRELQRRLSSIAYSYRAEMLNRVAYRESYFSKRDVSSLLNSNMTRLFAGETVTFTLNTSLVTTGPLATGQNAEWKYIFVELADIPATMGVPDAPNVDFELNLQAPFTKVERFADGTYVERNFTLWGVHTNYAFRAKAAETDDCFASVPVPGRLARNICQDGITDGYFSSAHFQLPSPFSTVSIRISNVAQLLAYDPNFFVNVHALYIGGIIVFNPRTHSVPSAQSTLGLKTFLKDHAAQPHQTA